MHRVRPALFLLRALLLGGVLLGSGCNGINLGDDPGPDVPKQVGPLTAPPAHLKDGSSS